MADNISPDPFRLRYLRIVTAAGTAAYVSTPCASIEAAMETASAVLRYGAIDAWVADENEKKVADFEAIKKHWAVRKA
jgi:hypothetical protein